MGSREGEEEEEVLDEEVLDSNDKQLERGYSRIVTAIWDA